ncbi:hypothetical protein JW835_03015 [bacterium]|nr:hypothetical protein [bacterium]
MRRETDLKIIEKLAEEREQENFELFRIKLELWHYDDEFDEGDYFL